MRARAADSDVATIRVEQDVTALAPDDDGVTATVTDRATGEESTLRAGWVIAADGNDSGARDALGIGRTGDADMGHFVNLFFRAPVRSLVAERPAWSYACMSPEFMGAFVTIDGGDTWILHCNLGPGERVEDYTP